MKLALVAAASLAGCTSDSPLAKVPVLVWVNADPTLSPPKVQVEIDPTDYLATLADAVAAGDIDVSIDGRPLVLESEDRLHAAGRIVQRAVRPAGQIRTRDAGCGHLHGTAASPHHRWSDHVARAVRRAVHERPRSGRADRAR